MENNNEITEKELDFALEEMYSLISGKSADFIKRFFDDLCTKAELKDFAKRWLLMREIDKGTTQREIAKKIHISLCKITRGSKVLRKPNGVVRAMLDEANSKNQ